MACSLGAHTACSNPTKLSSSHRAKWRVSSLGAHGARVVRSMTLLLHILKYLMFGVCFKKSTRRISEVAGSVTVWSAGSRGSSNKPFSVRRGEFKTWSSANLSSDCSLSMAFTTRENSAHFPPFPPPFDVEFLTPQTRSCLRQRSDPIPCANAFRSLAVIEWPYSNHMGTCWRAVRVPENGRFSELRTVGCKTQP